MSITFGVIEVRIVISELTEDPTVTPTPLVALNEIVSEDTSQGRGVGRDHTAEKAPCYCSLSLPPNEDHGVKTSPMRQVPGSSKKHRLEPS